MLTRRHSLFLFALLVACGASSASNVAAVSQDGGATNVDASTVPTIPPECDSPDASPALACGTLAFTTSPIASRARNHQVTILVPTSDGSNATFLYAIGGFNGQSAVLDKVDAYPINPDGSLGTSSAGPALTLPAGGLVGEYVNGVVVIAGGTTLVNGVTDKAFSAVVNADGTLGAWNPAGTIVNPRMHGGAVTQGNTMWILGGFATSTVYGDIVSATVNPDGTVSTWAAAGQLPGPRSHFSISLVNGYVYITGGLAASAFDNPPSLQDSWRGQILPDGTIGNWTQMTDLPVANASHASFFFGGYLHVCGGISGADTLENRCWRAPIQADHSLGAFEEVSSLNVARGHVHQMPVLGASVYSVAGAKDLNLDSTTEIDIGTFAIGNMQLRLPPPFETERVPSDLSQPKRSKCGHLIYERPKAE